MTVYQAIEKMRAFTRSKTPFAFSFMSYSRTKQQTHGIVEVKKALLRNRGKEEHNSLAEIMEEYTDLQTNENRRFYHPTLMTFNGQKLTLE